MCTVLAAISHFFCAFRIVVSNSHTAVLHIESSKVNKAYILLFIKLQLFYCSTRQSVVCQYHNHNRLILQFLQSVSCEKIHVISANLGE